MFISWAIIQNALELGLLYALVALALFLSYSMLNVCDLSTDGCYTLGCAVGSVVALSGHPILAIPAAMCSGVLSGFITAFMQTKLGIESLLAGIIVNTGLYTVNISIMGRATLSLNDASSVFTFFKDLTEGTPLADYYKLVVCLLFVLIVVVLMLLFLGTRMGLSIRATGNNPDMVKSSSINPSFMIIVGLCISNSITALSGCLIGEYQKSCDINMGTGMVTIALASLIIGETLFGRKGIPMRAVGVIVGACLYRIVVAIALRFNLPASALKLVSAVIVAVAIAAPKIRATIDFEQKKAVMQGKNFYFRMMCVLIACCLLLCALATVLDSVAAGMLLLAALCGIFAGWSCYNWRKTKGGAAVC